MRPVFSHGRLRLYLLRLLDESPRHGYEVISLLEDRFMGFYAPSPGTIYPRLQRLEAEGLVTHSQEGGRKVYQITDAGREELRRRGDELAELEAEISGSVRDLAQEIREEVRGSVRDLKDELKQAAREVRRQQRHENRSRRDSHGHDSSWPDRSEWWPGSWPQAGDPDERGSKFELRLQRFIERTERLGGRASLTEAQVREVATILDEAFERIRAVLRHTG